MKRVPYFKEIFLKLKALANGNPKISIYPSWWAWDQKMDVREGSMVLDGRVAETRALL